MSVAQLWTLEQSILGCGRKSLNHVSFEDLFAWAHRNGPDEPVPSLVWRTELALVYTRPRLADRDPWVRALVQALGYSLMDFDVLLNTVEFGPVSRGITDFVSERQMVRTYSYKVLMSEIGLFWTWDPTSRLTRGIIYCSLEFSGDAIKVYELLRGIRQNNHLRTNPLLLAFLSFKAEVVYMKGNTAHWDSQLAGAEVQTGRHNYREHDRHVDIARIDFGELSSDVAGIASSLSLCVSRLQILLKLADFIDEESKAAGTEILRQRIKAAGLLRSLEAAKAHISSRTQHIRVQADCILDRAQAHRWKAEIVLQTVFTLATQRDQDISIRIARDSKTLAQQATRDSTSMKAIAAVTMVFLPGTFVASFFAMPMFAWPIESGKSVSDKFWIYWAVTIPLTLVVVGVWAAWTNRGEVRQFIATAKTKLVRSDSESLSLPDLWSHHGYHRRSQHAQMTYRR